MRIVAEETAPMDHQKLPSLAPSCVSQRRVSVAENRLVARDTYQMTINDGMMARDIMPGQFLMIRPPSGTDPLLGRPFALYDVVHNTNSEVIALSVVYNIVGKGTAVLAKLRPGDEVSVWGPLGHPFGPPPAGGDVLFVAGGIGQTPFLTLGSWWLGRKTYSGSLIAHPAKSATLLYGIRSHDLAAGVEDFRRAGIHVELATDDGSAGYHGFVTDLLRNRLSQGKHPAKIVGCGPPPMLEALTKVVAEYQIPCDLALENHMACGFGACFSCVAPIRQDDGSVDLRRVCVEGPVFPADRVVWN